MRFSTIFLGVQYSMEGAQSQNAHMSPNFANLARKLCAVHPLCRAATPKTIGASSTDDEKFQVRVLISLHHPCHAVDGV